MIFVQKPSSIRHVPGHRGDSFAKDKVIEGGDSSVLSS